MKDTQYLSNATPNRCHCKLPRGCRTLRHYNCKGRLVSNMMLQTCRSYSCRALLSS